MSARQLCKATNPDPATWSAVKGDSTGRRIELDAPVPTVFCTRLKGHPGDHAAYVFSIVTPEHWAAEVMP